MIWTDSSKGKTSKEIRIKQFALTTSYVLGSVPTLFFLIHMTQREISDVPIAQVRKTRTKTFQVTGQALAEQAFLLRFVYIQTILNLNIGELCKWYKADWGNPKRMSYTLVPPPSHSASAEVGRKADFHRHSMGGGDMGGDTGKCPTRKQDLGGSRLRKEVGIGSPLGAYLCWLSKASVTRLCFLYWVPTISNRMFHVIASDIGNDVMNVTKIYAMKNS